jgi:PD-(D/E)XK nuclease superfamily
VIQRNISYSQIKTWQECRRAWVYQYKDGYKPKAPKLAFMRGSLLHLGMEYGILDRPNWWEEARATWSREWEMVGGEDELVVEPGWFEGCLEIVTGALEIFRRDWKLLSDDRGPLLERRMFSKLPGQEYQALVFVPDAVCEKLTDPFKGGVFVVDFKSYSKPKLQMAGDVDLQSAIYQHGLLEALYPAVGSCLFQLATEPRKPIRYKKDGEPYSGDQERYDNWSPVTGQLLSYRNPETVDGIWQQAILPAVKEMFEYEFHGKGEAVPHLSYYGCQYCDFYAPCQARLKGHDEYAILDDSYTRRDRR